jgi:choline dehydrogenase-like flavoprotein
MTGQKGPQRVVTASREIAASAARIFEPIADPTQQPRWDGNDNLKEAAPGQRVRAVGDVFTMRLTRGGIRDNHVVEFVEGRRIAWRPAVQGKSPPGHDAGSSVLDANCKAHEVDNLYLVDSSFFVSIGAVNPTLTIIANALRVGEHLLARLA